MDWTDALDYPILWKAVSAEVADPGTPRPRLYVVECHRLTGAYRLTTVTDGDGGAN